MLTKFQSIRYHVKVLILLILGIANYAKAQDIDVIKIKDGPEIEGRLLEIKNDTVYFMAVSKVLVKYSSDKVEVIKKKQDVSNDSNSILPSDSWKRARKLLPDSGYFISFSVGLALRAINPGIGLGYRVSSAFQPHLKVSYIEYIESPGKFILAYAGIKGNFKKDWRSPFYILRGGYGFNLTNSEDWRTIGELKDKKGGPGIEIGLGMNWTVINGKYTWNIAITQNIQKAQFEYNPFFWNRNVMITEDLTYYRTFIRLGFEF